MKCNRCDNVMETSTSTFNVVRGNDVYVVKDAPCFECPYCGHVAYSQKIAEELDRYVSGRVIPAKQGKAWIFKWGDPVVEIPQREVFNTTAAITNSIVVTTGS